MLSERRTDGQTDTAVEDFMLTEARDGTKHCDQWQNELN